MGLPAKLPLALLCCLAAVNAAAQQPDPYAYPSYPTTSPEEFAPPRIVEGEVPVGSWRELGNWIQPVKWDGSVELGINGSEGNAETISYHAGGELERKTECQVIGLDLKYARTNANSVETQHYGQLSTRWERLFGETPWNSFVNSYLLYDEFRAFDARVALNAGIGRRFLHTDTTTLTGRFGSGWSREIGGPDDRYVPEAVFGLDFERQMTKRQKLKFKGEYFPDWKDYSDYRLVMDVGWVLLLDEEANLSLKLAANDRYESRADGLKPNDINYSLLLLWKL